MIIRIGGNIHTLNTFTSLQVLSLELFMITCSVYSWFIVAIKLNMIRSGLSYTSYYDNKKPSRSI